jgi:hypothetical protein
MVRFRRIDTLEGVDFVELNLWCENLSAYQGNKKALGAGQRSVGFDQQLFEFLFGYTWWQSRDTRRAAGRTWALVDNGQTQFQSLLKDFEYFFGIAHATFDRVVKV